MGAEQNPPPVLDYTSPTIIYSAAAAMAFMNIALVFDIVVLVLMALQLLLKFFFFGEGIGYVKLIQLVLSLLAIRLGGEGSRRYRKAVDMAHIVKKTSRFRVRSRMHRYAFNLHHLMGAFSFPGPFRYG